MKLFKIKKISMMLPLSLLIFSCEDYLEVGSPEHRIIGEEVFNDDVSAISTMDGIYNQMFISAFSGGYENSVTMLGALSADALDYVRETDQSFVQFDQNYILPDNSRNLSLWSSAYNIIYLSNALLEGIESSKQISEIVRSSLEGEAKFIRAFAYFYLVNLYGEVPLILSTDYQKNALATQSPVITIYDQILADLSDASTLLEDDYRDGDRSHVNRSAALALLSRVHLYLEDWDEAERIAGLVIDNSQLYELQENLDETFLANSKEAIWQLSPIGNRSTYTHEAMIFLVNPIAPAWTLVGLNQEFIDKYDEGDKRLQNWIGYHAGAGLNYAFKYKYRSTTEKIIEYSMVLRLAEQYLIRAEARARKGNITGAVADLNIIRNRAGINILSPSEPNLSENQVIDSIIEERHKELFTEWGHRWFDLKRISKASIVLETENLLFPIPEEERRKNTNLKQNSGY